VAALLITAGIASAGHYRLTDTQTDTVSTAQYRVKWRYASEYDENWDPVCHTVTLPYSFDGEDPPGAFKFSTDYSHYPYGGGQYIDIYGDVQKFDAADNQWKAAPGVGPISATWVP